MEAAIPLWIQTQKQICQGKYSWHLPDNNENPIVRCKTQKHCVLASGLASHSEAGRLETQYFKAVHGLTDIFVCGIFGSRF